MKRIFIILTLFLFFINNMVYSADDIAVKEIKYITPDGFRMNAELRYKNIPNQQEIPTVVLLHSLGYSSTWWEDIPDKLTEKGYAVLLIDMRGHGKSVYNSKLTRVSWKSLTQKAYSKYPDDVIGILDYISKENPHKEFFNKWAIIGSDIGGITGIIAAKNYPINPKTIVFISPVVKAKGLYAPVKLAELDNVDILSICGIQDTSSINAQEYLKKFAQSAYVEYPSESKSSGMLMIKNDKTLSPLIIKWIEQYM